MLRSANLVVITQHAEPFPPFHHSPNWQRASVGLYYSISRQANDNVWVLARSSAADGAGDSPPSPIVIEAGFFVLVPGEGKPITPALLIPEGADHLPGADAIPRGEGLIVAGIEKPEPRPMGPGPARPEYARHQAFHKARRDVDDQVGDLAGGDGLQVLRHGLDMPIGDKGRIWLHRIPGLLGIVGQIALRSQTIPQLLSVEGDRLILGWETQLKSQSVELFGAELAGGDQSPQGLPLLDRQPCKAA